MCYLLVSLCTLSLDYDLARTASKDSLLARLRQFGCLRRRRDCRSSAHDGRLLVW